MRNRILWTIRAVIALIAVAQPETTFAEPAKPFDKWVVDYAETRCTASHSFGDKANPKMMSVRPTFFGNMIEFVIGENRPAPRFGEQKQGTFDLGQGPKQVGLLNYQLKAGLGVARIVIDRAQILNPSAIRRIQLKANGIHSDLQVDDFGKVFKLLDECVKDLQAYWPVNATPTNLGSGAKGNLRPLFSGNDYPNEAILAEQEGTAVYVLMVDETGKVAGCDLKETSGSATLDIMGCQVFLKRAKFTPAKDSSGKAVKDAVVTPPIRWQMTN